MPTSDAARNHEPSPYSYAQFTHPKIVAARAHMPAGTKLDWSQPAGTKCSFVRGRDSLRTHISELFQTRMAYYDGAMGTMIQKEKLEEKDFCADRFKDFDVPIKGNNDVLSITQPEIIKKIYKEYLEEGGSDMIGTNTFSSTTIAQADYNMEHLTYELNYEGARLAREACDEVSSTSASGGAWPRPREARQGGRSR